MSAPETLQDILREKKLKAIRLAERLGVTKGLMSKFVNGDWKASEDFIRRWSRAAGVPISRARPAYLRGVVARSLRMARWARSQLTTGRRGGIRPAR